MGSAAVFFQLGPSAACLSDLNEDLVICFQEVARDAHSVMECLDAMPNTRDFYMHVRATDPSNLDRTARAARVIYLNKTGFRGLWRVNRDGNFNVPYGEYDRPYYNAEPLLRASKALASAEILNCDYIDALRAAEHGDWVYLDPPYVPDRKWGDFKRYTPGRFEQEDHRRLAEAVRDLSDRGVHVMLTNSDTPLVRELFSDWIITELRTRRDIDLSADRRASSDLVVTNYTPAATLPLPLTEFEASTSVE